MKLEVGRRHCPRTHGGCWLHDRSRPILRSRTRGRWAAGETTDTSKRKHATQEGRLLGRRAQGADRATCLAVRTLTATGAALRAWLYYIRERERERDTDGCVRRRGLCAAARRTACRRLCIAPCT